MVDRLFVFPIDHIQWKKNPLDDCISFFFFLFYIINQQWKFAKKARKNSNQKQNSKTKNKNDKHNYQGTIHIYRFCQKNRNGKSFSNSLCSIIIIIIIIIGDKDDSKKMNPNREKEENHAKKYHYCLMMIFFWPLKYLSDGR